MSYIRLFREIGLRDIALVGGKNASLGQMIQAFRPQDIKIPDGFAITADAYWYILKYNQLLDRLKQIMNTIIEHDIATLQQAGSQARLLIQHAQVPDDLSQQISQAYDTLCQHYQEEQVPVAVRSSATAEDLPDASFAGQQETFLYISGAKRLLQAVRQCWASLFTDRAISYRLEKGFDHFQVALSVGVQKMVRADDGCSGVAFSLDTESGFQDVVMINGSYGLGESIVQGLVTPDEYLVSKRALRDGYVSIIKKQCGVKNTALKYNRSTAQIESVSIDEKISRLFCLSDDEIVLLSKQIVYIESYYSDHNKQWTPVDVEWAKDSIDGQLYITQARPETVHAHRNYQTLSYYQLSDQIDKNIVASGQAIGNKIVSGIVRVVRSIQDIGLVQSGEIIVTTMTDPDWVPVMKKAVGIVTERGGRTCHAAIVSRELRIAAIVGVQRAPEVFHTGQQITLDCSQGLVGYIYQGQIPFQEHTTMLAQLPTAPVPLYINIADAQSAFAHSFLPVQGVGLARTEFIIANSIQIHPMAFIHPDRVTDPALVACIEEKTSSYGDKTHYFIELLSQGIATIATAFYPRPVMVRFSDFKTNEYRNLIAGAFFEPIESNPMLGFRGASRYYHPDYQQAFALECKAVHRARLEMGFDNIMVMVPFVRTVPEAELVQEQMAKHGLRRAEHGLQIIMMCEIPSNVLLLDQFSHLFDGFSIGSNDLTQMVLAVDRDSPLLASLFDERDKAVRTMCEMAIFKAHQYEKPIGICGQGPSDYPEFAHYLIDTGIDYLSLNPDAIISFLSHYR